MLVLFRKARLVVDTFVNMENAVEDTVKAPLEATLNRDAVPVGEIAQVVKFKKSAPVDEAVLMPNHVPEAEVKLANVFPSQRRAVDVF